MSWILWHVFIISLDPEKDAKYQQSSAQIDAAKSKQTLEANKKSQQRLTRAQETAIGRGQRSTIGDKSVGDLGVDFVWIHCGKIGHVRGGKFLFISSATGYCFAQRRGAQGCCFWRDIGSCGRFICNVFIGAESSSCRSYVREQREERKDLTNGNGGTRLKRKETNQK